MHQQLCNGFGGAGDDGDAKTLTLKAQALEDEIGQLVQELRRRQRLHKMLYTQDGDGGQPGVLREEEKTLAEALAALGVEDEEEDQIEPGFDEMLEQDLERLRGDYSPVVFDRRSPGTTSGFAHELQEMGAATKTPRFNRCH